MEKGELDNHANQLNPNNDAYWQSRGWEERPEDWEERPEDREEPAQQDQGQQSKSK